MSGDTPSPLLEAGRNCWRIERADRVGFAIAGEAFFRAARQSLLLAERHAVILAWDLHSEVRLERDADEPDDGLPSQVGPFFDALLERRPELHLHILLWDFSMIYAAEREWRLFSDSFRDPHPRLHLRVDDRLPRGASHHQKVILVDDAFAFAGGLDLSQWRWDTAAHHLKDERRTDPDGKPYDPYHDIQMAVTGPAALALGDLCAERWQRATGESLPRVDAPATPAPWPDSLETALEDAPVGIARTYAAWEPWPAVHEVERLHLDLIAGARDYLYFENQYFSSRRIADAIADRLREPNGPEVIIVMTQDTGGLLEEGTMGRLKDRLFELLSEADEHGRLRLFFPRVADDEGEESAQVYVHAKVLIADDRILKVGSSNLSNRSMRVDSELDLVVERPAPDPSIRRWLHHLLGVHFRTEADTVAARVGESASLVEAVDGMRSDTGHSLWPLEFGCDSDLERQVADTQLLDPDEPIDPDHWIRNFVPGDERPSVLRRITLLSVLVLATLALAFLVKEGWGRVLDRETVVRHFEALQAHPAGLPALVCIIAVAGLAGVPLTLLLVGATVAMGPWVALACGFVGAHLSALAGYGIGHRLGKPLVKRWTSENVERIDRLLRDRGVLSVIFVRIVPVAPFAVINLVAGASQLRFRVFTLGNVLGMLPGMSAVILLTHQLNAAITNPGWDTILGFAAVFLAVGGAVIFIRRALRARSRPD